MSEDTWASEAASVAEALNLLGVVAAPRLRTKWCAQATASELHTALLDRLTALAAFCERAWGSTDADRFRAAAPKVRGFADAVARAAPSGGLFEPLWTSLAQECWAALGFPVPPEGWESFEGWSTPSR